MGIFNKLFGNKESSENTEKLNFDILVEKARNSGSVDDLNELYKSFFKLEKLSFIVSNNCDIENPKPFIGIVDEVPWIFAFTDNKKANEYAVEKGNFQTKDGSTFILVLTLKSAISVFAQLDERGVYGIRINDGENGWFTKISGLWDIMSHLKIENNIKL
ncbi:hypothetical protein FLGE108171_15615 [Flavobacterium gelidilacus]|uniref:hypothetical protein n=1 Tax=Flavobacterium gelidilacus TaxID=206041 RepID=UPI00041F9A5D|nr:hypothetical protein [Flavobacterium gelidilacus]